MATLVFSAIGSSIGGAIGGSFLGITAAAWGQGVGASLGGLLDQRLMGSDEQTVSRGKIDSFRFQNSVEGMPIGRVMGRNRVAGQVIWASDLIETLSTQTIGGGGKFNPQPSVRSETYTYSISLAIALCEGEISKIGRIWADSAEIARSDLDITLYTGRADQQPDAVIAEHEGIENTPAFRNTAYVVIRDLQLLDFGNRIPQFNFEVFRKSSPIGDVEPHVSDILTGVALIPGSGEYSLSTTPVRYEGDFSNTPSANVHSNRGEADIVHAIEDLRADLPNADSVVLVNSWFGDDLRCGECTLTPRVEHITTDGQNMAWSVSGMPRADAQQVSYKDERPIFGGTPCDESVLESLKLLHENNIRVVYYPFIMMDIQADNGLPDPWGWGEEQSIIPWRGRITASVAPGRPDTPDKTADIHNEIDRFFGTVSPDDFDLSNGALHYRGAAEWSYSRFILHNAALCAQAGGVDSFCIGSELRGLTQLRDDQNRFPFVEKLIGLARDVRKILGKDCNIGYAADWSEYFGYHPSDGSGDLFFHLDPLWADENIDFIGIDNYMPLSDWRDEKEHLDKSYGEIYNQSYLQGNIEGGEGYDWYYASQIDRSLQIRTPITDGAYNEPWVWRYKDIRNWWQNYHFDRIGGIRQKEPSLWKPHVKPIWFTEIGFPAVDKGTNQPNVFIDPKSSESQAPSYSNGRHDLQIQESGLNALMRYWLNDENNPKSTLYDGRMIDTSRIHVWAWDARPWPDFPLRKDVWSDGDNYELGHWISGRMGGDSLAGVVAELCEMAGVYTYDVSDLDRGIMGISIKGSETIREILSGLMIAYNFTCAENEGVLKFTFIQNKEPIKIDSGNIVVPDKNIDAFSLIRNSSQSLITQTSLGYWDGDAHYQYAQFEQRQSHVDIPTKLRIELPVVLRQFQAETIASRLLHQQGVEREQVSLILPASNFDLMVGDIISCELFANGAAFRILSIEEHGQRHIEAIRMRPPMVEFVASNKNNAIALPNYHPPSPVYANFMDLPHFEGQNTNADSISPYIGVAASPWPKEAVVYTSDGQGGYELGQYFPAACVFGRTINDLPKAIPHRWAGQSLDLWLSSGYLSAATEAAVLNGANKLAIKHENDTEWEILQFQNAEFLGQGRYRINRLLRGQYGTDALMPDIHPTGSLIALLDQRVKMLPVDYDQLYQVQTCRYGSARLPYTDDTYQSQELYYRGVPLRPYSPVHLRMRRVESNDIMISWIRRTRKVGDYWAAFEVPLEESTEAYVVTIIKDGNPVRVINTSEPKAIYTQLQQNEDALSGVIEISVAQLSMLYGAGAETRIMINV